jgi:pyridinium-3,5-bisthiocarboxylic acid mononucleotide nickel chelatase
VSTAWFHCFNGVAGDMALGALLDAGADLQMVRDMLGRLPVEGWSVEPTRTSRNGIAATAAGVHAHEGSEHRTHTDITHLLDVAALPARVDQRARSVFAALARAEGAVHGVPVADVEFHEVGSLDAIIDVVGVCAALEVLGVDEVRCSPIACGLGTVRGAHGVLPNPAPAVAALLVGVPSVGVDVPVELATPTGVALMVALASGFGPLPSMTPSAVGYGAGSGEMEGRPNVVQVVIGELHDLPGISFPGQPVVLLEANVDDTTGEVLAHAVTALLAVGAHDAWVTPIVMKKGRPAHTVHALCDPAMATAIGETLVRETGTLGVRGTTLDRWPQARREVIIDLDGCPVRVKVSGHHVKVEHDDAAAAARTLGRPLRDVLVDVEARARRRAPA